jgi:hypothetical protein
MPIPFNRLVAFAGPYISLLAGALSALIFAKLNALGIPGLEQDDLTQQIAGALTFTLAAALSWLGQSQWLKGHHLQLAGDAGVQAAALASAAPHAVDDVPPDPEHDALMSWGEDLPDDEEEFAMPPDEEARMSPEVPA